MNSVIHAGVQGLLQSQQAMQKHAHDIASQGANITSPTTSADAASSGGVTPDAPNISGVSNTSGAEDNRSRPDTAESVIALQQQEQLFTASASVIKVGSEAVGSLIDDYS